MTFAQDVLNASAEYARSPAAAKAAATKQTVVEKRVVRNAKVLALAKVGHVCDTLPSVWDTARGGEFPLHTAWIETLLNEKGGVIGAAGAWQRTLCGTYTTHSEFPAFVPYRRLISLNESNMDDDSLEIAKDILKDIRGILAPRGCKADVYRPVGCERLQS